LVHIENVVRLLNAKRKNQKAHFNLAEAIALFTSERLGRFIFALLHHSLVGILWGVTNRCCIFTDLAARAAGMVETFRVVCATVRIGLVGFLSSGGRAVDPTPLLFHHSVMLCSPLCVDLFLCEIVCATTGYAEDAPANPVICMSVDIPGTMCMTKADEPHVFRTKLI
jgi:hypothetical protein